MVHVLLVMVGSSLPGGLIFQAEKLIYELDIRGVRVESRAAHPCWACDFGDCWINIWEFTK